MSIHEGRLHKQLALDAPFDANHENQVLTFLEWCQLNRISESTGERIIRSGEGPKITMMSARRRGVTVGHNRIWQKSRTRG